MFTTKQYAYYIGIYLCYILLYLITLNYHIHAPIRHLPDYTCDIYLKRCNDDAIIAMLCRLAPGLLAWLGWLNLLHIHDFTPAKAAACANTL